MQKPLVHDHIFCEPAINDQPGCQSGEPTSWQIIARATTLARNGGDPSVALRAVYNLAINRNDSGDLGGAERILEDGLAEAERAGLALTVFGVELLNMLLQALVQAGEWDKALATHARARVRVPGVQRDWVQVPTLPVIAARTCSSSERGLAPREDRS